MKKLLLSQLLFVIYSLVAAQPVVITGPTGSEKFGRNVTVLSNGNYVVCDPLFDNGAVADVGAVHLYNGSTHTLISTLKGGTANDRVGITSRFDELSVKALSNGNFVVVSSYWDNGTAADAGAVTWVNGTTGLNGVISSANSLVGTSTGDRIGYRITQLTNGNYVIGSQLWKNGTAALAGAATWCDGSTGRTGAVSAANSLVGINTNDVVGADIYSLTNGNYVVESSFSGVGALTWCNGNTGRTGTVTSANSLTGSPGDYIGGTVTSLPNGNYVVYSDYWSNGGSQFAAGAYTWCNGASGTTGVVSAANSLVGTIADDFSQSELKVLPNGNYVITAPQWDNGTIAEAGAVIFCNSNTGVSGTVSTANALVGSFANDQLGYGGITPLTNSNYIISSPFCKVGTDTLAGAATWASGTTGITGAVSSINSLVGSTPGDRVSSTGIIALTNGNYVVGSVNWHDASADSYPRGAATWGNGNTGINGIISNSNSLVGVYPIDNIGAKLTALTNGNYLVISPQCDWTSSSGTSYQDIGAVTWCNGSTGETGNPSDANSCFGSGNFSLLGNNPVVPLTNGNYVITRTNYTATTVTDTTSGAVYWCNGSTGRTGRLSIIDTSTALFGPKVNDHAGSGGVFALPNGNYVVCSPDWGNTSTTLDAGAVTWCNGSAGRTGTVNKSNSIIGSTPNDQIGGAQLLSNLSAIEILPNGDYIIRSPHFDGAVPESGAITVCNSSKAITGTINSCNSAIGNANNAASSVDGINFVFNPAYGHVIVRLPVENKIVIFKSTGQALASSTTSHTDHINGGGAADFVDANCRLIASLQPVGSSPVSGNTTAKVWIDNVQPAQYLKRHFELLPANNATTSTGKITLYVTQSEFDDFNAVNSIDLPGSSSDAAGIANLLIEQRNGGSNDNSGIPGSYAGTITTINPADAAIIWNNFYNRWEITFDVTGFGGYFVKTINAALPIKWLSAAVSLSAFNKAAIQWKVVESNVLQYEIEKSTDGVSFSKTGLVTSKGNGENDYIFNDLLPFAAGNDFTFYRIRQTEINGQFSYSKILKVTRPKKENIWIAPNPARDYVSITSDFGADCIEIIDASGKIIASFKQSADNNYNLSMLSPGIYILKLSNKTNSRTTKLVMQ